MSFACVRGGLFAWLFVPCLSVRWRGCLLTCAFARLVTRVLDSLVIHLFVCSLPCVFVRLPVYVPACFSACFPVCLRARALACSLVHVFACLAACPSVCLSLCLPVWSTCLSACLLCYSCVAQRRPRDRVVKRRTSAAWPARTRLRCHAHRLARCHTHTAHALPHARSSRVVIRTRLPRCRTHGT
jgi:hypothetical protein